MTAPDLAAPCFRRDLSEDRGVALLTALLAVVVGLTALGLFVLDESRWLARATPFPKLAIKLTGEALAAFPALFLPTLALLWARSRYGRCHLGEEELTVHPLFAGEITIPLAAVVDRRVTPHGVLLRVPGRGTQAEHLCPLLIPTNGDAEEAQVLGHLDRRPEHVRLTRTPQSVRHNVALAAAVAAPLAIQWFAVGPFQTMFEETGITLPALTDALITGRLLVWAAAAHILAIALGGTWRPARVTVAAWVANGLYVAVVVLALFLPLIQLIDHI